MTEAQTVNGKTSKIGSRGERAMISVDPETRDILRDEGRKAGLGIAHTVRLLARKLRSGGIGLL